MEHRLNTIFVTGTGTGVGKTFVTCAVLTALRQDGTPVLARKLVESFDPDDAAPRDSELLGAASCESPETVCSRQVPLAMAPPNAAALLGLPPFSIEDLCRDLTQHGTAVAGWCFVEGAGGIASPLASDGDNRDAIDALNPECTLVVAHAGLGTLNDCRLVHDYLADRPHQFFLNRYDANDPIHADNLAALRRFAEVSTSVAEVTAQLIP